ncbi:MAG: hypothetical protein WBV82_20235, partial [Myxococcaceae bacterium]
RPEARARQGRRPGVPGGIEPRPSGSIVLGNSAEIAEEDEEQDLNGGLARGDDARVPRQTAAPQPYAEYRLGDRLPLRRIEFPMRPEEPVQNPLCRLAREDLTERLLQQGPRPGEP